MTWEEVQERTLSSAVWISSAVVLKKPPTSMAYSIPCKLENVRILQKHIF